MMCQRKKELQANKPTGPLYGRGVRVIYSNRFFRHDGVLRAKGATNRVRMPAKEHTGSHRHREPFVRVTCDRIRVADSGEMAAKARRDDGSTPPCGIDVKPEVLRPAEARQLR